MAPLTPVHVSSLSDTAVLDALREAEIRRRQLYRDELVLVAEIEARGITTSRGIHIETSALLRDMFNLSSPEAQRMVAHAEALCGTVTPTGARIDPQLPVVADALADGMISPGHVEAIRKAVTGLPDTASPEDRAIAEKILCEAAITSEPSHVKRLGDEIALRLDPDGDEPKDKDLLRPQRRLDVQETRDGRVLGRFDLDTETGALLTTLLSPHTAPQPTEDEPDRRSRSERYGDAFRDILTLAAQCESTPSEAGEPATLMVSITLEELKSGIGHGLVDGYWNLSAAQIRRIACDAAVVPVVLGSKSEILDIGRATRVVPRAIRRALIRRDRGCSFPGCAKKAKWCAAHHILEWYFGGPTALENLTLVCHYHHRVLHHSEWKVRMMQGFPEYIPPSYVDPERRPRRNTLHSMRT
ncbi:HNH endonuclease signature motif containing protein [Amycolatopsis pigmentata]|uniref:DUF222 domain-containing protein n=1 Tax=Amycolatopsis pigmentata TaxID=450801 RepID=A0ABW5FNA8_9PSEU